MNESEIFACALKLASPAERTAYLDEACAGRSQLRADVEALLRAHASDPDFLELPAGELGETLDEPATPPSPHGPSAGAAREQPGALLAGRYRLIEEIGSGGMGTVWKAEQTEPVTRLVAVKLIKAGMDSVQMLARFEAERQALALMDHPNVARVLDAGSTDSGRPYFVMELVEGLPITRYCDEQRLTVRQRLELFIPVCQAIQHAHQKGIIHRDIKPSNVLVASYDGKPVPKVIDFGIAKAAGPQLTEQSLFTDFGTIVGTLEYMSPEQAELSQLDIDTRSDVYSLGVLLYELLTGSTPLDRKRLKEASTLKLLRLIREEEPASPSARLGSTDQLPAVAANRGLEPKKLCGQVRGELDWIVMKALEKDRTRRYESPSALAADVRRHLEDEPVLACQPSVSYRMRKFVRRHRGPVLAGLLFLLLLLLGIVGTTIGLLRALTAEQKVIQESARKDEALRRNQKALKALTHDVVQSLLGRQVEVTDEDLTFLKHVQALHEEFAAASGDSPEGRESQAQACLCLGLIHHHLGHVKDAELAWREGVRLFEALAAESPDRTDFLQGLAFCHKNLGGLLRGDGRLAEAESEHRTALALLARRGTDHRGELGLGHNNLGNVLVDMGRRKEAEQSYRDAVTLLTPLVDGSPGRLVFRYELAQSHYSLGNLLSEMKRPKEAEQSYRQALVLQKQLAESFPTRPDFRRDLAYCHNSLANLYRSTDRPKKAEESFREALKLQRQLAADFTARPGFRQDLALIDYNLGGLLHATGRVDEAEAAFREALALRQQLVQDSPDRLGFRLDLARSHCSLGVLLGGERRRKEAEPAYRDALALLKRLAADFPDRPEFRQELARAYHALGDLTRETGRLKEAEAAYDTALRIWKHLVEEFPDRPDFRLDLATSQCKLAGLLRDTGRPREAEAAYHNALALLKRLADGFPDRPDYRVTLARCHQNLGVLLRAARRPREAEAAWRAAVALLQKLVADYPARPEYRFNLALSQTSLGNALRDTDRPKEAEAAYREALALLKQLPADCPTPAGFREALARAHHNLAVLLHKTGRPKEAEISWSAARDAWQRLIADYPAPDFQNELAGTFANLAVLRYERQDFAAAVPLLEQARPHHQAALKASPNNPLYRRFYHSHLQTLAMCYLGLGDHARLAATADQVLRFGYDPATDTLVAASLLGSCLTLADKDARLTAARRKELTQSYTDQALALIRQAVERDYMDAAHLKQDPNLEPLRAREEFRKLLGELERKKKE
jgi:serine/threonine protein kinase/tetratricopeptide (TPR) repeat protein